MAENPALQGGLTPRSRRILRSLIVGEGLDSQTAYKLAKQSERKSPPWRDFLREYDLKEEDLARGLR